MVSKRQRELVHEAVQQALKDGAKLECGGNFASGWILLPATVPDRMPARRPRNHASRRLFAGVAHCHLRDARPGAIAYANDCSTG